MVIRNPLAFGFGKMGPALNYSLIDFFATNLQGGEGIRCIQPIIAPGIRKCRKKNPGIKIGFAIE